MKLFLNFIYTKALQSKGSWISTDARFETVPLFPHGIYGVFISGGVTIGRHCIIFQNVTIGSNTLIDSANLGAPVLGDNCYIGAGAKIIGNISVGHNVRVGANAVCARDVPDNSIVTVEQRVATKKHFLSNRFYQKYKGKWRYFEGGKWYQVVDGRESELLESRFPIQRM